MISAAEVAVRRADRSSRSPASWRRWPPIAALGLALASPSLAESPPSSGPAPVWPRTDRLADDPAGARSRLERLGLDVQLFYQQYLSAKAPGGGADDDRELGSSGSYDLFGRADLQALSGWRGAEFLFHAKGQYDRNVNADVGALSDPIDDADFDSGIYVDELWLQQALFGRRVRVRVGYMEQQTVFDRNAYANSEDRQFTSSDLDNDGLVPLPVGLAATFFIAPAPWLEIALGAADADNRPRRAGFRTFFDGASSLTGLFEAKIQSPLEASGRPGALRVGFFRDGRKLADFDSGRSDRGHFGAYVSFDQHVWRPGWSGGEGLGVFGRAGWADPDVSRVAWFWSVGFAHAGPVPGRSDDVLGLGVHQAIASSSARAADGSRLHEETGLELYYALRALGWLVITPDLQYVIDPGTAGADDAFVATLRVRVSF